MAVGLAGALVVVLSAAVLLAVELSEAPFAVELDLIVEDLGDWGHLVRLQEDDWDVDHTMACLMVEEGSVSFPALRLSCNLYHVILWSLMQ